MIELLIYDRDGNERRRVVTHASDMVAVMSDDKLVCHSFETAESVDGHLKDDLAYDLSVLEIMNDNDIDLSRRVREGRHQSDIMLLADCSISPMKYLTPDIQACSLLLKPCEDEMMKSVIKTFMSAYFRKREVPDAGNSLVIESRSGRTVIPYSQIYYIEAREKKVYFRLRDREYSKYDTLENVRKTLPQAFIQSHRSFIFNVSYLDRIRLSENTVYLENNITVPLSRSYKAAVREYLSGLSGNRNDYSE